MKALNNILSDVALLMVKLTCVLLLMLTGLMLVRLKWYWARRFGDHLIGGSERKPVSSPRQTQLDIHISLSHRALNNIPEDADSVVETQAKALPEAKPTPVVLEPIEPSRGPKRVLTARK